MRVKGVTPFLVDLGGGKNLLFVKVETEGGPHGWGECYTQADRDASIVAHVEALARYLVGREAAHITHFVHMAYHDFAAKRGAHGFLERGERSRAGAAGTSRASATASRCTSSWAGPVASASASMPTAGTATAPRRLCEAGAGDGGARLHRAQVRPVSRAVAHPYPLEAEEQAVATVAAVREAVGPAVDLLIEVHRRLAPMHAVRIARAIEPYRPFWYEEPVSSTNLEALAECRRQIQHPHRDGRGALHARGVPPRLRAARRRHRQSRRLQLRRHHGAARHRPDGRAVAR